MGSAVTQMGQNLTGNMQALGDKTRLLTGPIFNEGVEKPKGIPDNWPEGPTDKGGGRQWVNPDNPHDRVRAMPGDPNSSNPSQREPYVRDVRNGNQWLDQNGNRIEGKEGKQSDTTHIPAKDYKFPQ